MGRGRPGLCIVIIMYAFYQRPRQGERKIKDAENQKNRNQYYCERAQRNPES